MTEETYQIRISCSNCGYVQVKPIDIPKGKTWHEHTDELKLECDHCGCHAQMNIAH